MRMHKRGDSQTEEEGQSMEVAGTVGPTRPFPSPVGQWPGQLYFMIPEKANEM